MAKVELDIRAQIANLNKGLDKTEKQLKDLQQQSNKTSKAIQGNMNQTNTAVTKLTGALGALLTVGAAVQFTKAIINVRKEFETFRAVLTNTLGSAEAANKEFAKIQQFASETPFSVRELTDSFVRLVNQGFKPTTKEMKALGDLAASTGKEFIQLTEAIIDAQVGEFERLKEFGIRAQKEGDKVTFTFKEQQTQVDLTSKAIQEYILSLGEVQGVQGAMIAISETLEGKISNMGDAWDSFLDVLGGRTSGVFTTVISGMSDIIAKATELLEVTDPTQRGQRRGTGIINSYIMGDNEGETIFNLTEINKELEHFNKQIDNIDEAIEKIETEGSILKSMGLGTDEEAIASLRDLRTEYAVIVSTIEEGIGIKDEDEDANIVAGNTVADLQKKLKGLNKEKLELNVTDTERISQINRETQAIKDQITELNKLGVAQKVKTPKIDVLEIDEGKGILELEKELAAEQLAIQKQLDQDILDSHLKRIAEIEAAILAAELQKQLIQAGTVEAVVSGLDLIAAANKDNAEVQQAISIAQAIINGSVGITKTGAELGYPAAIPFQIALGLQTLAQIATIRSQKFERGGYDVLSGRRHAQGGIDIGIGEAEAGEGVAVFSRQATQKYGKFLPAFVKAINENKTDITEGGSYSFNYDDSRSVGKLEDIRKLLSKADVSYENGYRIETRNGQRTKVKV